MINRKIFFMWENEKFSPYTLLPGEDIKYYPKQGYGVMEIASWFSSDLQAGIDSVNTWIANFTDLEHSKAPDGNFGQGNAHYVLVKGDYVFIGTQYSKDSQVLLTREQILYVLEQYKHFLSGKYRDPDNPPETIDVEFIAEGKEAIEMFDNLEGKLLTPYYYKDLN